MNGQHTESKRHVAAYALLRKSDWQASSATKKKKGCHKTNM
jgi:hypothetical protein